jgi:hypothetical protein
MKNVVLEKHSNKVKNIVKKKEELKKTISIDKMVTLWRGNNVFITYSERWRALPL